MARIRKNILVISDKLCWNSQYSTRQFELGEKIWELAVSVCTVYAILCAGATQNQMLIGTQF
jgi:hypothetical protein